MSLSPSSPSPVPPARVAAVLAAFRAAFPVVPPGACFARVVVVPGQVSSLVAVSGAVLVPGAWRLVSVVSGAGGWLLLAPACPAASPAAQQPALFK